MKFDDERIDAVRMGAALTPEEREHLVTDTPSFEECAHTEQELRAMDDATLMTACMWVWADYCR
jgi:hypothetical protein